MESMDDTDDSNTKNKNQVELWKRVRKHFVPYFCCHLPFVLSRTYLNESFVKNHFSLSIFNLCEKRYHVLFSYSLCHLGYNHLISNSVCYCFLLYRLLPKINNLFFYSLYVISTFSGAFVFLGIRYHYLNKYVQTGNY